jgi:hypothetical protein
MQCFLVFIKLWKNVYKIQKLGWWYINSVIVFLDIIHNPVLFKTTVWRLNSISICRWTLFSWVHSIYVVTISGPHNKHNISYMNQAQHKPSVRVRTHIKNSKQFYAHEVWYLYPILCWCLWQEMSTSSTDWAQLNRFHLKTETESILQIIVHFK